VLVAVGPADDGAPVSAVMPVETAAPVEPVAPAPVSAAEAEDVLARYARAYEAEDALALTALMTDDVVRVNGDDPPSRGVDAVAAAYAEQFDALVAPGYTIVPASFEPGPETAVAHAGYAISSANADMASGVIAFHLVRTDAGVLIDRLEIVPE
jgi:ketosteroid isomerase-like protein